jgi:hypothetical protein
MQLAGVKPATPGPFPKFMMNSAPKGRSRYGVFHVRIVRHGVEHSLERIGLHPIAKAFEHRVPFAEGRR